MKRVHWIFATSFVVVLFFGSMFFFSCQKNLCKGVACQNGGTCADGTCSCPPGYEGKYCENLKANIFAGVYPGTQSCSMVCSPTYTLTITSSATMGEVILSNMMGLGTSVTGYTAGNLLTIPAQPMSGFTITGSGTLTGNTITLNYSISVGSCTFVGSK